jgi:hypothetical protein
MSSPPKIEFRKGGGRRENREENLFYLLPSIFSLLLSPQAEAW